MLLKGSCHCGSVVFELESAHPVPFNRCYCSIGRKTAGGADWHERLGLVHQGSAGKRRV